MGNLISSESLIRDSFLDDRVTTPTSAWNKWSLYTNLITVTRHPFVGVVVSSGQHGKSSLICKLLSESGDMFHGMVVFTNTRSKSLYQSCVSNVMPLDGKLLDHLLDSLLSKNSLKGSPPLLLVLDMDVEYNLVPRKIWNKLIANRHFLNMTIWFTAQSLGNLPMVVRTNLDLCVVGCFQTQIQKEITLLKKNWIEFKTFPNGVRDELIATCSNPKYQFTLFDPIHKNYANLEVKKRELGRVTWFELEFQLEKHLSFLPDCLVKLVSHYFSEEEESLGAFSRTKETREGLYDILHRVGSGVGSGVASVTKKRCKER